MLVNLQSRSVAGADSMRSSRTQLEDFPRSGLKMGQIVCPPISVCDFRFSDFSLVAGFCASLLLDGELLLCWRWRGRKRWDGDEVRSKRSAIRRWLLALRYWRQRSLPGWWCSRSVCWPWPKRFRRLPKSMRRSNMVWWKPTRESWPDRRRYARYESLSAYGLRAVRETAL